VRDAERCPPALSQGKSGCGRYGRGVALGVMEQKRSRLDLMRRIAIFLGGACLLLALGMYVLLLLPLPMKRTVYQEDSSDGTMTAIYSYWPSGLAGWVLGEDSYVYLDVYRKGQREPLLHSSGFGDVPWEGVDRLHNDLPWPAKRITGHPFLESVPSATNAQP
jgi:hypothetical protein